MKKAKLDILEEIPDLDIEINDVQEVADQSIDTEPEGAGRFAFNKLLMVGLPVMLIVLAISGFIVYYIISGIISGSEKSEATSIKKEMDRERSNFSPGLMDAKQPQISLPSGPLNLHLKDFIVDLKDSGGNNHVLMFDVVLDIKGEYKQTYNEDSYVLRNAIYKVAKSQNPIALRSVEERKKLKKDMGDALEKILGEGTVKNIYFTTYFIM